MGPTFFLHPNLDSQFCQQCTPKFNCNFFSFHKTIFRNIITNSIQPNVGSLFKISVRQEIQSSMFCPFEFYACGIECA